MEHEWKWKATPALHEQIAAWAKLQCTQQTMYEMQACYYDTADALLAQKKCGLRMRTENEEQICCLKCEVQTKGGVYVREEFEVQAQTIAQGLLALQEVGAPQALCAKLQRAGVHEVARTQFTRHAFLICVQQMTAELALDDGQLAREIYTAPLCEIELEYKTGMQAQFDVLANSLQQTFSLVAEPQSKLARALRLPLSIV